jgi:aspartyl-tRNA(Asn)/glutamyl-tRNA(Gln) amidotransferase subunit A
MLHQLTITEAKNKLKNKEITSVELTNAVFAQIEKQEPQIKAYLSLQKEQALQQAAKADTSLNRGDNAPLLGIPIAIKDNMNLIGTETTCASKILKGYISPYTATAVQKLIDAGAVIIGKTNLDEFAMGSSTENSAFQKTTNPWNTAYVPGGSSGGSAAAVSADECIASLGSDTGGSIRQPAAFCGVVGLKPTYGLVSRFGLVAFASSLDQIGPFTKTVADCALLTQAIAGYDPADSTSFNGNLPNFTGSLNKDVKGMKIAVVKDLIGEGIDKGVRDAVHTALEKIKSLGVTVDEIEMPSFKYALATYYLVATSEASANLSRFDGVRFGHRQPDAPDLITMYSQTRDQGFGSEVKRRIMLGTYALSAGYYDAYYLKAQKVRTIIKQDYQKAFAKYDAVISPTSPTPPFKFGDKVNDPLSMYLSDIATIPVNLAGVPGISIPCGLANGLPVGLQIVTDAFQEEKLLQIANAFEKVCQFERKKI